MHSALRFRFGDALNPVNAAFVLELAVNALARNHKHKLLCAAKLGVIHIYFLNLPAVCVRKMPVHLHKLGAEQRSLVSARARAYLHNNVVIFVGVLGQHCKLYFLYVPLERLAQLVRLLPRKILHFRVGFCGDNGIAILEVAFMPLVFRVLLHYRHKVGMLLRQRPELLLIGKYLRLGQAVANLAVACFYFIQL